MFSSVAFAQGARTLNNPLANVPTIDALLYSILNVLLVFAVPIIVFFLIYAGFTYVTAQGNPEKIKIASRSLLYALIGGIIIIGAFAITAIVQSVVNAF